MTGNNAIGPSITSITASINRAASALATFSAVPIYSGEAPAGEGPDTYFSIWDTALSKFVCVAHTDSRGRIQILISPHEHEQVLRNATALSYILACSRFGGLIRFGFLMDAGADFDYTIPEALAIAARGFAEGDDEELDEIERNLEDLLEQVRLIRSSR